jgi:hypothetical protein
MATDNHNQTCDGGQERYGTVDTVPEVYLYFPFYVVRHTWEGPFLLSQTWKVSAVYFVVCDRRRYTIPHIKSQGSDRLRHPYQQACSAANLKDDLKSLNTMSVALMSFEGRLTRSIVSGLRIWVNIRAAGSTVDAMTAH